MKNIPEEFQKRLYQNNAEDDRARTACDDSMWSADRKSEWRITHYSAGRIMDFGRPGGTSGTGETV